MRFTERKKDFYGVIETIENFFKSELYCNDSQIIWFKLEFRNACKYTSTDFKAFDEYLSYFNEHGLKNKDKQNIPVPIAARIKTLRNQISLMSQEEFDEESRKNELANNYKFARKYETSEKALYYFEQLWEQEGFNRNLTAYKRLCSFYDDTGQYEKVIQISNEYFQSNARKTITSPDWFRRKIEKAEKMLKNNSSENTQKSDVNTLENSDEIMNKVYLKKEGNYFIKSKDYDEAEDFYKELLMDKLFLNDYYPYRKLVEVYRKKKDSVNVIKTIGDFFKSELYCNNSQLLWFKLEFRNACKYTSTDFKAFDEYLSYFNEHGLKNKDKQNISVPIAARIKIYRNQISVMSQEEFDKESRKNELANNYKFARKYETSEKALYYFEQLWEQEGFNKNLTAYKRLCSFYDDTGQYEKVIQISNEYFQSNARKTITSPNWFRRKIEKAEKMLSSNMVS